MTRVQRNTSKKEVCEVYTQMYAAALVELGKVLILDYNSQNSLPLHSGHVNLRF